MGPQQSGKLLAAGTYDNTEQEADAERDQQSCQRIAFDRRLSVLERIYGHVLSARGDGRSVSKQATLTVSPNLIGSGLSNFYVAAGYTLASVRALQRGFDASTFGSPTDRVWTRGDLDARHQLLLQGGYGTNNLTLTMIGRLQSGLPFTPLIGGDVTLPFGRYERSADDTQIGRTTATRTTIVLTHPRDTLR